MKHTNALMLMIAKFLYGEYDAEQFSFDFPATLSDAYDAFHEENADLCDYLEEEMPEVCGYFDPHDTGDPDTLDEERFRSHVMEIYQKALPLSMRPAS
jgi:hypothetical protein